MLKHDQNAYNVTICFWISSTYVCHLEVHELTSKASMSNITNAVRMEKNNIYKKNYHVDFLFHGNIIRSFKAISYFRLTQTSFSHIIFVYLRGELVPSR